ESQEGLADATDLVLERRPKGLHLVDDHAVPRLPRHRMSLTGYDYLLGRVVREISEGQRFGGLGPPFFHGRWHPYRLEAVAENSQQRSPVACLSSYSQRFVGDPTTFVIVAREDQLCSQQGRKSSFGRASVPENCIACGVQNLDPVPIDFSGSRKGPPA